MHILVNGLSARLGGGQTYLRNLLRHVPREEGWRLFLLCSDTLDLSGFPDNVERIQLTTNLDNPLRRAVWEALNLCTLAQKLNADVLFCPGGLLPVGRLPRRLKTVVTFQNLLPFDTAQRKRYPLLSYRRLRDWLLERGLSSAMRKADLVVFISEYARNLITQRLGYLRGFSTIVPHGIDKRFFRQAEHPLPRPMLAPQGEYFLYVSFIDHYKSQIEVVRAFARLRSVTKTQATLMLVGAEYSPYGEVLRHEIAKLGLQEAVRITGKLPHNDLPGLYQHARLSLFASCTENCPNILLEMMASGRPALVSDHGPMPEFGGDAVVYFDPDNIEQFVERWGLMLTQPDKAERLAALAAERVHGMDWASAAEKTWKAMALLVRQSP